MTFVKGSEMLADRAGRIIEEDYEGLAPVGGSSDGVVEFMGSFKVEICLVMIVT